MDHLLTWKDDLTSDDSSGDSYATDTLSLPPVLAKGLDQKQSRGNDYETEPTRPTTPIDGTRPKEARKSRSRPSTPSPQRLPEALPRLPRRRSISIPRRVPFADIDPLTDQNTTDYGLQDMGLTNIEASRRRAAIAARR